MGRRRGSALTALCYLQHLSVSPNEGATCYRAATSATAGREGGTVLLLHLGKRRSRKVKSPKFNEHHVLDLQLKSSGTRSGGKIQKAQEGPCKRDAIQLR